ncbi:YDG/SRA domain-containing protein [Solwaraspora sp. WMMB335]|uniref:YDG/SRA domain-containing protein n=1 Tax=Solwaraspora sp. WMMB335 TaxID=3404118 RepID=UPI003B93C9D3
MFTFLRPIAYCAGMAERTYGEIPGYPPGSTFANRNALAGSKVHRPLQGGICGGADGAESIVVSGGYVDDEDYGNEIVYTGQGGNDPRTKRQVADQKLTLGNLGLARSRLDGNPVRVIRGAGGDKDHSPTAGFRYDGLFRVVDHWTATGTDGFKIWRFRLVAIEIRDLPEKLGQPAAHEPVSRVEATIQRLARSAARATEVKRLHDYTCQICNTRLVTPAGPYAEACHIKPLGKPHNGPDVTENLLCLCPNHHLLFDTGALYIDSDGRVHDTINNTAIVDLQLTDKHPIDWSFAEYHRQSHLTDNETS